MRKPGPTRTGTPAEIKIVFALTTLIDCVQVFVLNLTL